MASRVTYRYFHVHEDSNERSPFEVKIAVVPVTRLLAKSKRDEKCSKSQRPILNTIVGEKAVACQDLQFVSASHQVIQLTARLRVLPTLNSF